MTDQPSFHRYPCGVFEGDDYVASEALATAVNTALAVDQPLLVTGKPGTGKTQLAASIALRLGLGRVFKFVVRSEDRARDCQYRFDSLRRLSDAQTREKGAPLVPASEYVEWEPLGHAFLSDTQRVVLIDEIDKAPRDFPNDLLGILESDPTAADAEGSLPRFYVTETRQWVRAKHRPFVLITSNSERQLPDAFLRRCVFHHIEFPDKDQLAAILRAKRVDGKVIGEALVQAAAGRFLALRGAKGTRLEKEPATSELLVWVRALLRAGKSPAQVENDPLSELFPGALLKLESDLRDVLRAEAQGPAKPT
jgi:MoxR-like ATPase